MVHAGDVGVVTTQREGPQVGCTEAELGPVGGDVGHRHRGGRRAPGAGEVAVEPGHQARRPGGAVRVDERPDTERGGQPPGGGAGGRPGGPAQDRGPGGGPGAPAGVVEAGVLRTLARGRPSRGGRGTRGRGVRDRPVTTATRLTVSARTGRLPRVLRTVMRVSPRDVDGSRPRPGVTLVQSRPIHMTGRRAGVAATGRASGCGTPPGRQRPHTVRAAAAPRAAARTAGRHAAATAASWAERSTSRGRHGSKPVERQHRVVPVRAPRPRRGRAARPASVSIRGVNPTPSQSHSQRRYASGSRRKSPASMTGGALRPSCPSAAPAGAGRCPPARTTPGTGRRTRPPRPGRGPAARCGTRGPRQVGVVGEVVGHVLGVVHADAVRQGRQQAADHLRDVGGLGGERPRRGRDGRCRSGRGTRRRTARRRRRVSGRFSHARIIAVEMLRGPLHTATRTTPSGSRRRCARRRRRPPGRRTARCRRSTTGPRRPLPMVRPSTVRTGTTPANVPVTNASRAL